MVYENGEKIFYLKVLQAIYGCIESALLWYNLFSSTLEKMGFEVNPYDRCVANKIIVGKKFTIMWYVDDNKISHVSTRVVTMVLNRIEEHFGKLDVSRGNLHDLLGMHIVLNREKKKRR